MTAYYNENDPFAADWLENLITEGLIARGVVDRRSIAEVEPDELEGYVQVHLFAGIGGWSLALRLAGWPDDRPVWTGSCPCQPFSPAGKRKGYGDERHLWPEMYRLVQERQPPAVFGEQVAGKDGLAWLAGVRADLEAAGYAVGAADLPAASVGAPHERQRIFWCGMADSADAEYQTSKAKKCSKRPQVESGRSSGLSSFWESCERVNCWYGNQRRIESGLEPLVDGVSFLLADGRARSDTSRAEVLRGIGNAIVPQVAAEFVRAAGIL